MQITLALRVVVVSFLFSCLFSNLKRRTARRTLRVENPAACLLPMPRAELVQKLLARQANVAPTVFLRFAFYGWGVMWKNMGGEFFLQSVCFRFSFSSTFSLSFQRRCASVTRARGPMRCLWATQPRLPATRLCAQRTSVALLVCVFV